MGTRSTLAIERADNTVELVYCHWDGYIEHNGKILQEHYSDPDKLQELIDCGDLSSLGRNVAPTNEHTFDKPQTGVCVFYGRDRGEANTMKSKFTDFDHYVANHEQQDYGYILRKDGVWYVKPHLFDYVRLTTELAARVPAI
jgi:hypothetical protein